LKTEDWRSVAEEFDEKKGPIGFLQSIAETAKQMVSDEQLPMKVSSKGRNRNMRSINQNQQVSKWESIRSVCEDACGTKD